MKKSFYKAAAGIAGVLFVASAMTLVEPKAVHALVSALVTVANTSANPVPAQEVKESRANFATLSFNGSSYDEILPDGSRSAFTIPIGQQFVITDVSWITVCANSPSNGLTCNKSIGGAVTLVLGASGPLGLGSYMSRDLYSSQNGAAFTAGRSDALKSGLVVAQLPTPSILFGPSGNGEYILAVTLRGYLVP